MKLIAVSGTQNAAALVEADAVPALVRALISMDEILLQRVIRILAKLLKKLPHLRTTYMDLNVVESLLLSYSSETPKEMLNDITTILTAVSQNNETASTFNALFMGKILIPVVAELIYTHEPQRILKFLRDFSGALTSRLAGDKNAALDSEIMSQILKICFRVRKNVKTSRLDLRSSCESLGLGEFDDDMMDILELTGMVDEDEEAESDGGDPSESGIETEAEDTDTKDEKETEEVDRGTCKALQYSVGFGFVKVLELFALR